MKYINQSVKLYLNHISRATPAPGGGSGAAAAAAIGVSLLLMSARFSLKSNHCSIDNKRMSNIIKRLMSYKMELAFLVDRDVEAYLNLRNYLSLSKGKKIAKTLEAAYKGAAIPPLRVCEISHNALREADYLFDITSKHVLSDLICGGILQASAFSLGRINAELNLKYIKDRVFVCNAKSKLSTMRKNIKKIINKF